MTAAQASTRTSIPTATWPLRASCPATRSRACRCRRTSHAAAPSVENCSSGRAFWPSQSSAPTASSTTRAASTRRTGCSWPPPTWMRPTAAPRSSRPRSSAASPAATCIRSMLQAILTCANCARSGCRRPHATCSVWATCRLDAATGSPPTRSNAGARVTRSSPPCASANAPVLPLMSSGS